MDGTVWASAPASSANLGPGFDVLALALDLRCRVEAMTAREWTVTHRGEHHPAEGAGDAVLAGAIRSVGDENPLRLLVDNQIPLGKGLGSSAAALTAGSAAAHRAVNGEADPTTVFEMVADMEDHCDNAAAAVFGGLVMCAPGSHPRRLELHSIYQPVVLIPDARTLTKESRNSIPPSYDREVVVRTISRAAHLITGLTGGDPGFLDDAQGDEIHESIRGLALPWIGELMTKTRKAGAAHVSVSGSGPAVLALVTKDNMDEFMANTAGFDTDVRPIPVAREGLL